MKVLLDTHTFLWWNLNTPKLSDSVRKIIGDGQNEVYFSAVSGWEISLKYGKGRLTLPDPPDIYVPSRLSYYRFIPLPIQLSHVVEAYKLPDIHQDPFDRLLIVQSQMEQIPIVTVDGDIVKYNVATVW